jgi:hypothetical protein
LGVFATEWAVGEGGQGLERGVGVHGGVDLAELGGVAAGHGRRLFLIMWTTHVWTTVAGKAVWMASSNPARPSQQAMRMSRTPRLRRSAVTLAQNRPDLPAVALSSGVLASQTGLSLEPEPP